ncbi:peptidoglycan-binding domain-containing protein [Anabaena sp. UHCC 0399]|uniref:peptidoglycan-binding domain-containing protein n=1 Tax=Anabaena sp. UHCC 0399 TaxID=3110238 RepID=UPI001682CE79|nr:peptidoglycan-binding protein [Anabaena sp. UHCC 0399]MBD2364094.1 peptidoglycan-binding protein [Anabaena minutissima FACHB-250]MEA5565808.1 peptidoglycan-binding domain-containing protein [Anabaena sp. UHCC 0399]
MNDIVLLVTGVLAIKQTPPSIVPKQPVIQLDNGVKKTTYVEPYQLVSSAKITPPEFVPPSESSSNIKLAFNPENQQSSIKKTDLIKDAYSVDEFRNFQAVRVKVPRQPRIIAQQIRNEIIIARRSQRSIRNVPNLRFGNSGSAVRVLQRLLVANGYNLPVDGVYGALTESAVKAFQVQRNLQVDGVVGSNTWRSLTVYR